MPANNAIPIIDHVDTLSMSVRHGVVRSMTRKARVINVQGTDYNALMLAFLAPLPKFGAVPIIPQFGSTLGDIGFEQLVLIDHDVSIVDGDPSTFDVILKYEHIMDGPNQNLLNPSSGVIWGKTAFSVQQKTTNFYREWDKAEDKFTPIVPILVGHVYPNPDPAKPGAYEPHSPQGGEISVMVPQRTYTVEGWMDTIDPGLFVINIQGTINSEPWLDGGKFEWLCTDCKYEMMAMPLNNFIPGNLGRYKFFFEWQHNSDTWNPSAVFIDYKTGKPPPNLTFDPLFLPPEGVLTGPLLNNPNIINFFSSKKPLPGQEYGFKYIPYYKAIDFNTYFGAQFDAWSPPPG